MLRQYENSIDDKRQFTALVKDIFPEEAKNINMILMAYNMGIAQDIQKANLLNNTFAFRYVKQLMDDYGISRVNADWIVSVWCSCYGNKVLGKACDISVQKQGGGPAIKDNKSSSGKSYGELFVYEKSRRGNGLAATGFRGDKNQTIIFQNRSGNENVIEIADNSFSKSSIEEAIAHINKYNTRHSEAILTNNKENAEKFLNEVDAACVYLNASTRFTDGFEFGFGAEIGISTQKLHARGPMGLLALTSIKFVVYGNGQVRS